VFNCRRREGHEPEVAQVLEHLLMALVLALLYCLADHARISIFHHRLQKLIYVPSEAFGARTFSIYGAIR